MRIIKIVRRSLNISRHIVQRSARKSLKLFTTVEEEHEMHKALKALLLSVLESMTEQTELCNETSYEKYKTKATEKARVNGDTKCKFLNETSVTEMQRSFLCSLNVLARDWFRKYRGKLLTGLSSRRFFDEMQIRRGFLRMSERVQLTEQSTAAITLPINSLCFLLHLLSHQHLPGCIRSTGNRPTNNKTLS